jgi:hypothetical protein
VANPVLKGALYSQTAAQFGTAGVLQWPASSLTANAPATVAQLAVIPCNVKVLCLSVLATGAAGNSGLAVNVASGAAIGTFGGGTATFGGTATANGTAQLTILNAAGTTTIQTVPLNITSAETAAAAATAMAGAINAATTNPQVTAVAAGAAVTLTQLSEGAQTYRCSIATPGMTFTPTVATPFSASTATQGSPDNFATHTPSSAFAANGQFLFASFQPVPIVLATAATQANLFPGVTGGPGVGLGTTVSTAAYDIIFPMNRPLALCYSLGGFASGTVAVSASALVVPVILDPNQPYPVAGMWTPNNTTIGCPSTA